MHVKDSFLKTKIVIFGCGYIGARLAASCQLLGWEVTALTRNVETAQTLHAKGIKTIVADLKNKDWHQKITPDQNYVVDCVGAAAPTLEGYEASYRLGMQSILHWLEGGDEKVDAFLFTSSTSVYPQTDGSLVTEDSGNNGVSPRGEILLDAEKLCLHGNRERISKSFVLRFAGLYGPGRHLLLNKVREGQQINGVSHRILNLLHQEDAVSSILSCLQSKNIPTGTIFNVSDGRHASRGEIVDWLARELQVEHPGFDQKDVPGLPNRKIDNSKIMESLSWAPRFPGFESGYQDLLATS